MPVTITGTAEGARFGVKVVPGASRDHIAGVLGDVLKITVSAPPEDGQANKSVARVLAAAFGVAASSVEIVTGHTRPRKEVVVRGVSAAHAAAVIAGWEQGASAGSK